VEDDARVMQCRGVVRVFGEDRRVPLERVAQPALAVQSERVFKGCGELHGRGVRAARRGALYCCLPAPRITDPATVTVTAFLPPSTGMGGDGAASAIVAIAMPR
jgi:hypothetical protein